MRSINSSSPGPSTRNSLKPSAMMTTPSSVQAIAWRKRCRPDRAHGGQGRCHQQRHEADLRRKPPWKLDAVKPVCFSVAKQARPQDGSRPARATPPAGRTAPPPR